MTGSLARHAIVLLLPVLSSTGCIRVGARGASISMPVPSGVVMESRNIELPPLERSGVIEPARMTALAPFVRSLRAEPSEVTVQRGDTLHITDQLRVLALDSAGTVLGELPFSDYGYRGRGFFMLADGRVTFNRPGTVRYTVQWPASAWSGAASRRPTVQVPIRVVE
jgi:hypothetical protein